MKSKGNKIEYLCPYCKSPDIDQCILYGQNSGICNNRECRSWWPWKWRLKVSLKEKPKGKQEPSVEPLIKDINLSTFVSHVTPDVKIPPHMEQLMNTLAVR